MISKHISSFAEYQIIIDKQEILEPLRLNKNIESKDLEGHPPFIPPVVYNMKKITGHGVTSNGKSSVQD